VKVPYELFISLRYLKAKRKQTFISIITLISILGVALGVMALIVVLAVMSGFEYELRSKILGANAHILVYRYGGELEGYRSLVKKIQGIEGVSSASPFIFTQVMVTSEVGVSGAVLRGIEEGSDPFLERHMVEGRIEALREGEVILGRELAKNLGVFPGDYVTVISPKGRISPLGVTPRTKRFKVGGIFQLGMYDYDSTFAYISLKQAQRFLGLGDVVTAIEVRVKDIYAARRIARKIEDLLGPSFVARDWMEMNRNLFSALRMEKRVMFVLLSLIIGVAAFNIVGTLIMVVMEKTRDIAILKSMGATRRSIMKIFVLEGLIVGVVGTALGTAFGLLLALNVEKASQWIERVFGFEILPADVYYITQLPSRVDPVDVVVIVVVAIGLSLLATLYPAWKASSLDPVEALRYE